MDSSLKVLTNPVKIPWPSGYPATKQNWSLSYLIIDYMLMNLTNAEVYQKLIQCCKYFFEKNHVLVVAQMENCSDGVHSRICPEKYCKMNDEKCCIKVDINKLESKIWLTCELDIGFGVLLCHKFYRSDISFLDLANQAITFDDFKFLASSAVEITLHNNSITYNNGDFVMLDEILECLQKVEKLDFESDICLVNKTTMANVMKLENLKNLKSIDLRNIPDSLNLEDLSTFIKKQKDTTIWLNFSRTISEDYKDQLDALIDEIIESGVWEHIIIYEGQDLEKLKKLKSEMKDDGEIDFDVEDDE